jgi:glycogen(starch) synthase
VGSEGGGLKDAIGSCGATFRNGDVDDLTKVLSHLVRHPESQVGFRAHAEEHLARHTSAAVAAAYLRVIEAAARGSGR